MLDKKVSQMQDEREEQRPLTGAYEELESSVSEKCLRSSNIWTSWCHLPYEPPYFWKEKFRSCLEKIFILLSNFYIYFSFIAQILKNMLIAVLYLLFLDGS